ncbi:unnamed protein product [Cylindrotheca closterium]|uniref:Uncharacterized protein n=1 Tax=Cylindrotheca closterium TaxID=2856 RepID=A0AAD2FJR7_9STRA|nr:unnamed protein product [Cylindrotheca closterium]
MPLTIKIDDSTIVKAWVDVAFAVREDFKSHTGNMISMGKGALYARSMKQKLNTTSTTSQERVGSSIFGAGGQRTDGKNMTKMTRPMVTWADRVRGFAGGIARPESLGPAHKKRLLNR